MTQLLLSGVLVTIPANESMFLSKVGSLSTKASSSNETKEKIKRKMTKIIIIKKNQHRKKQRTSLQKKNEKIKPFIEK